MLPLHSQLVCGGFASYAIVEPGQLWSWGSALGKDHSNGNLLGRASMHGVYPIIMDERVVYVTASSYTALAIDSRGMDTVGS